MKIIALRPTVVACAALLLTGCATAPGRPGLGDQFKQTFASDDPCSNNARNIGIVGGAVLGAVLGNAMGGGKNESMVIGAALGGFMGGFIGADMDRKRCELSKVAKQYDLNITFANIDSQGAVNAAGGAAQGASEGASRTTAISTVIGNSVTIRDRDGLSGHFESDSDQLTAKAQIYFSAIAAQYASETIAATETDSRRKAEVMKQLAKRRILLVGHTDDTGASQANANLSERRARAVASFLMQKGIPEQNIYYQGAGESFPLADNRTEAGRAANRRVEIVELADEAGFKSYLETRKPQYAFYRSQPDANAAPNRNPGVPADAPIGSKATRSDAATSAKTSEPKNGTKIAEAKKAVPATPQIVSAPATVPAGSNINFGGVAYTPNLAKIETGAMLQDKSFSLFSKAQADDSILVTDCSYDRPRAVGAVRSLQDGRIYKTSEHLPQLYGKTWASDVNGNLVVLNRLAILRDGGVPANLPELKVYAEYQPGSNAKPTVNEEPAVNSYLVDKGVLYRVFPKGGGGLKCMDVLFGTDGATTAKAGKLIYLGAGGRYVADFKPKLQ